MSSDLVGGADEGGSGVGPRRGNGEAGEGWGAGSREQSAGQSGEHSAAVKRDGEVGGVLSLRDLTVERGGRPVVRDVSIEIPAGEVTALLGPNGAGKSSLVLAVGGVLRPRAGSVLLQGRDLAGRRPERIRQAGIAIVPEGRRLLTELTVEDNIRSRWSCWPRHSSRSLATC
jgi:ABC-type bacteriocin/lantibiotic exporter with double-glycine peptidase domain